MKELVNLLNELFEKYKVDEQDIVAVQQAVANVEGDDNDEFVYEKESEDDE